MELHKTLQVLDLSSKEERVLLAVIQGLHTPLLISRETKVTRPAVYDILIKLKKRGLVESRVREGKKSWHFVRKEDIDQKLYETKKALLSLSEGVEEVKGLSDGTVVVHKGKEAAQKLVSSFARDYAGQRLQNFSGDKAQKGLDEFIGKTKINEFNENAKKNGILTELAVPYGWFDHQIESLGNEAGYEWAKGFIDRALGTYQLDQKYFSSGGQIWIFKSSLYLISMNEALIIEVKHSELQKMMKDIFQFIKDHSGKIDANSVLQKKLR